ncbi:sortase domain-bontaining protein [Frankia sp. Cas3]|uniref:sortase domain-containing protein n=1 Tax=Frankia sp. Cas3 TaxID=3073926 RepID=UPI002AD3AB8B|nr:sortase [Frankia sp. Cas3]
MVTTFGIAAVIAAVIAAGIAARVRTGLRRRAGRAGAIGLLGLLTACIGTAAGWSGRPAHAATAVSGAHGAVRVVDAAPGPDLTVAGAGPSPLALRFREPSGYRRVPAGAVRLTLTRDGSADLSVPVEAPPGGTVSVIVTGTSALAARVVVDGFTAPGAGRIAVRLIHAADGVGPVSLVDAAGGPLGNPVGPGTVSPLVTVPAGSTTFGLRRPGAKSDLIVVGPVQARPGDVVGVLLSGGSGDAPVAAGWTVDARGTAVPPVGPVRTGTGTSTSTSTVDATVSRVRRSVAVVLACCLVLAACSATGTATGTATGAATGTATGADPTTIPSPPAGGTGWGSPHHPVGLILPGASGPAPVVPVGLVGGDEQQGIRLAGAADGELATAPDGYTVGWYSGGPAPGEPGSAVLAGHVDLHRMPAVFARLRDLEPGAEVVVVRADGGRLVFTVDRIDVYPKSALPADILYRPAPLPELRLVTCDGPVEGGTHRDNLVVSLSLQG